VTSFIFAIDLFSHTATKCRVRPSSEATYYRLYHPEQRGAITVVIAITKSIETLLYNYFKAMKQSKIILSKQDVARHQLETAIQLYFTGGDSVSAYALTAAASDVLRNIAASKSQETVLDEMMKHVIPEKRDEFIEMMKRPKNFFKHAQKDPSETIEFHPDSFHIPLLLAVEMYAELTGNPTQLMEAYHLWQLTINPDLIVKDSGFYRDMADSLNSKLLSINMTKEDFYQFGYIEGGMPELTLLKQAVIQREKLK
jgi:hypothetical protein